MPSASNRENSFSRCSLGNLDPPVTMTTSWPCCAMRRANSYERVGCELSRMAKNWWMYRIRIGASSVGRGRPETNGTIVAHPGAQAHTLPTAEVTRR